MKNDLLISEQKTALRKKMSELRNSIDEQERAEAAFKIAHVDLAPLSLNNSAIVAGYYPIRSECNGLELMARLENEGHILALPIIQDNDEVLYFRKWSQDAPLIPGSFSIPIPETHAPEVSPDILLIPLLAFDHQGYRLGYGKGHYDKTLANLRFKKAIVTIGLAFECQEVDAVPHDHFDYPLDFIVTSSGLKKTHNT